MAETETTERDAESDAVDTRAGLAAPSRGRPRRRDNGLRVVQDWKAQGHHAVLDERDRLVTRSSNLEELNRFIEQWPDSRTGKMPKATRVAPVVILNDDVTDDDD